MEGWTSERKNPIKKRTNALKINVKPQVRIGENNGRSEEKRCADRIRQSLLRAYFEASYESCVLFVSCFDLIVRLWQVVRRAVAGSVGGKLVTVIWPEAGGRDAVAHGLLCT